MGKIKLLFAFFAVAAAFALLGLSSSAEGKIESGLTLSHHASALTDCNEKSPVTVKETLTIRSETPVDTLYLIYYTEPVDFTLQWGEKSIVIQGKFLRRAVNLKEWTGSSQKEFSITFAAETRLTEINLFSGDTLPSWVQVWEDPCEKADLCLMTTHADDEQLFFAGLLPYYAGEKDLAVQVIYFTDHINEPFRRHELLMGLWTVGVENYPVIGPVPDRYSESEAQAQRYAESAGLSRSAIVDFYVEILRRFRPLVVAGHDPEGEYGHGQHRLNSATLREAVTLAGSAENHPSSAERYGVWEVPKNYLHSYGENTIRMNWDIPLDRFGGKTAFQVSQQGFACHGSQQNTWFRTWLTGNGSITRAAQITTYSPCKWGLFRSTVGADVLKNDFFENLKTYEEQRIEEEETRRREQHAALISSLQQEFEREAEEAREGLAQAEREREQFLLEEAAAQERARLRKEKGRLAVLFAAGGIVLIEIVMILRRKRR